MQSLAPIHDDFTRQYTIAIDALCAIARGYFFRGRLSDALHLLRTTQSFLEATEVAPQPRLQLLLLYGQILTVDHLLTRGDSELLFSTISQAKQLAEATQNQQGNADALSLLGVAHYFTTVTAGLKSSGSPDSPQSEGKYDAALAYQQQALQLREELHDTRGISESYFQIGAIHERWGQYDQSYEYYMKARQIADQYDHPFEKTEPTRHLTLDALRRGDLDQALTLGLQALQLREEAGFKPYQPLDHLLLRNIYETKGDTANAQFHLQRATILAEEMGFTTLISSVPSRRDMLKILRGDAEA